MNNGVLSVNLRWLLVVALLSVRSVAEYNTKCPVDVVGEKSYKSIARKDGTCVIVLPMLNVYQCPSGDLYEIYKCAHEMCQVYFGPNSYLYGASEIRNDIGLFSDKAENTWMLSHVMVSMTEIFAKRTSRGELIKVVEWNGAETEKEETGSMERMDSYVLLTQSTPITKGLPMYGVLNFSSGNPVIEYTDGWDPITHFACVSPQQTTNCERTLVTGKGCLYDPEVQECRTTYYEYPQDVRKSVGCFDDMQHTHCKCSCVEASASEWSSWSTTCGKGHRERYIPFKSRDKSINCAIKKHKETLCCYQWQDRELDDDCFHFDQKGVSLRTDKCDPIGGKRVRDTNGHYKCYCYPQFTGHFCEIAPQRCSESTCKPFGICKNITTGGLECTCQRGFEGKYCETKIEKKPEEGSSTVIVISIISSLVGISLLTILIILLRRRQKRKKKGDKPKTGGKDNQDSTMESSRQFSTQSTFRR